MKKTMANRFGAAAFLAASALLWRGGVDAAFAQTVTVKNVSARQRWPWSNLVDIDYTVEGVGTDTNGLYIRFEVVDGTETNAAAALDNPFPPVTDGDWRVTWDPVKDNVRLKSAGAVCRAAIFRDDPERYMVIDLSGGPDAENYPVGYLPAPPSGGWTDAHRTTNLVMRKIEPGSFLMGSPDGELGRKDNEDRHRVTLTDSFYIGVFEVTRKQWSQVTGTADNWFDNDLGPAALISYDMIRGASDGTNWPASPAVDADSFLGKIRQKTGRALDLPTEAQWEYACRAGTETALNNGMDLTNETADAALAGLALYLGNVQRCAKGTFAFADAGSCRPNAWGLYDMHGNAWEWCLDWYEKNLGTAATTNPAGKASGSERVIRGGSLDNNADFCRSAVRYPEGAGTTGDGYSPSESYGFGFRLSGTPSGGGPREWTAAARLCGAGSGAFMMDVAEGVRPALFEPVAGIVWSGLWDGGPGGAVEVSEDGEAEPFHTGEGEGVCAWTPRKAGVNTLRHKDGDAVLTAQFLVMRNAAIGRDYAFKLEEADAVIGPPPHAWSAAPHELPAGLSLSPEGVLSGRASCAPGDYRFTAEIKNADGVSFIKTYPLRVVSGGTLIILR